MAATSTSLKEYLKKYEAGDQQQDSKKKRKKKKAAKPSAPGGVLIVDEDPVWAKPVVLDAEEEEPAGDETPVVDEDIDVKRLRRLELLRAQKPYHAISEDGSGWVSISDAPASPSPSNPAAEETDLSPPRRSRARFDTPSPERDGREPSGTRSDDSSPPRRRRRRYDSPDPQPVRQPPGSGGEGVPDVSPPRRRDPGEAISPPRRAARSSPPVVDLSPPRRRRVISSEDLSPPRSSKRDVSEDLSPPRRGKKPSPRGLSPSRIGSMASSEDLSPPRRGRKGRQEDLSPPRRERRSAPEDEDLSPPRRDRHHLFGAKRSQESVEANLSPPRRSKKSSVVGSSPPRRGHLSPEADLSPPRESRKKHLLTKEERRSGLFTGQEIKEEIDRKKKEDTARFAALDPALSGRGAEPIYRDKEGKRISKEEMLKMQKKEEKPKEKKLEWGKGLAQKRGAEMRALELELEKEKPFARSRDDPELNKMLRERPRWGDPMAHLVKKKHSEPVLEDFGGDEKMKESGFIIPQAIPSHSWIKRGIDPPSNRYGIRPGRHWDGVDRSSGYEKEMFKRQNEKRAVESESYLWSVSDM